MASDEIVRCRQMLARVDAFLDGELTEDEADEVRRHLDACEHCLDHADVEAAMRGLLKRCCGGQRAPESLRTRIVMQYTRVEFRGH